MKASTKFLIGVGVAGLAFCWYYRSVLFGTHATGAILPQPGAPTSSAEMHMAIEAAEIARRRGLVGPQLDKFVLATLQAQRQAVASGEDLID